MAYDPEMCRAALFCLARLDAEAPHTEAETPHNDLCDPHTPHSEAEAPPAPWRVNDGTVADTFAWREDNDDVALAIYINTWAQVVIRGDNNPECPTCGEPVLNPVILINPRDVEIVIAKLRAVTDEWLRSGRQR
jgi:hypothetical protein